MYTNILEKEAKTTDDKNKNTHTETTLGTRQVLGE